MRLVDAAADVLSRNPGKELSVKEIAEQAMTEGLITPSSQTPWVYMAAAIRKEIRHAAETGGKARFRTEASGRYRWAN
jgi:HB1/ASXL restriction endonuclease-like protein with HTH domain